MKTTLLLALASTASAQFSWGTCPDVDHVAVDSASFAGEWYEVARGAVPLSSYECTTQQFVLNDDGDLDFYFRANFLGFYNGIGGTATCGESNDHSCAAVMPTTSEPEKERPMYFIDTDYENYAVSYTCVDDV